MKLEEALKNGAAFRTLDSLLAALGKKISDVKTPKCEWVGVIFQDYVEKDGRKIEFYYCMTCKAYIVGTLKTVYSEEAHTCFGDSNVHTCFGSYNGLPSYPCLVCGTNQEV